MGNFDIEEAVEAIKRIMLIIGTWPERSSSFLYKAVGFITMFTMNLQGASLGICCSLASFHSVMKHSMMFFNKTQFYQIMNILKQPVLAFHEESLNVYLQQKVRVCNLYRPAFFICGLSTGFMIVICPIFDTKTERPLAVPFPLNMDEQFLTVYYLVYFFQALSLTFVCWSIPCFDGIIFTFIAIASGQLRIVREKITRAVDLSKASSSHSPKNYDITVNNILKDCVNQHIAIEKYISLIEKTFTVGFLIQLLISLIITCLIGFNFILLPVRSVDFARCFLFFCSVLIELAFFCVPGNEIILQSEKIRDACYMSEWTECSQSVRKTLFIIMERSKRPLILTAAGFVDLSLETLVNVLKSAFSYFTVLMQLYSNAEKA